MLPQWKGRKRLNLPKLMLLFKLYVLSDSGRIPDQLCELCALQKWVVRGESLKKKPELEFGLPGCEGSWGWKHVIMSLPGNPRSDIALLLEMLDSEVNANFKNIFLSSASILEAYLRPSRQLDSFHTLATPRPKPALTSWRWALCVSSAVPRFLCSPSDPLLLSASPAPTFHQEWRAPFLNAWPLQWQCLFLCPYHSNSFIIILWSYCFG